MKSSLCPNGPARRVLGAQCLLQGREQPGKAAGTSSLFSALFSQGVTGSCHRGGWRTSGKRLFPVSKLFVNIWLLFNDLHGCPSETYLILNAVKNNNKINHFLKFWVLGGSCFSKQCHFLFFIYLFYYYFNFIFVLKLLLNFWAFYESHC